jgi:hypothetical protein
LGVADGVSDGKPAITSLSMMRRVAQERIKHGSTTLDLTVLHGWTSSYDTVLTISIEHDVSWECIHMFPIVCLIHFVAGV